MHLSTAPVAASMNAPAAKSPKYVIFLATIAGISGFLFGFDTAVINGVLLYLRHEFALNNVQTQSAASALLVGCLIGAAGASLIGDRLGRRKSLMSAAFLFAVSTIAAALAPSLVIFSLGRFLGGLAIGLASVLTPVYISEIAPAKNRGALVSMNQLSIVIGILCSYLVSWKLGFLGDVSWRWMLGVAAIPAVAFCIGLFFIPESPRWLITHGHEEAGMAVLARIFGAAEANVQAQVVRQAAAEEDGSWKEVFAQPMRKRLTIAVMLAIICQITGVNTVFYYGSILISENIKIQATDTALAANVFIGLVNLIFTVLSMLFLDRWGRRPMLILATSTMTISLAGLSYAFHANSAAMLFVFIFGYIASFAFAMGTVPWIVISEIFPTKVRSRAASLATSALWTSTLLVTSTFLTLIDILGTSGTFALYAILAFLSFGYIWWAVPETGRRTLEEIQMHLEK